MLLSSGNGFVVLLPGCVGRDCAQVLTFLGLAVASREKMTFLTGGEMSNQQRQRLEAAVP